MVFKHVEVGSSPKEPDFDLFARVGRRGGDPTLLLDWRVADSFGLLRPSGCAKQKKLKKKEKQNLPSQVEGTSRGHKAGDQPGG